MFVSVNGESPIIILRFSRLPQLNLYLRMRILPVLARLGAAVVLDGELRAAVQAAEAHHAAILDPDGMLVLHLNGLNRTFLGAKSAADAVPVRRQVACFSRTFVHRIGNLPELAAANRYLDHFANL